MRHRVRHMASFRQAVAVLSISFVGCSSPAPDPLAETAWGAATVVEELSIGVEFGADEYMFGYVESIAVAADDTFYVSDQQQNIVRMYDGDGAFVSNIGRQGQGPGEYGSAPTLGVLRDGTLVMGDGRASRTSFFSSAGEYLDSFPTVPGRSFVVDREGNIHVQRFDGLVSVAYSREGDELERVALPPRDMAGAETFMLALGAAPRFLTSSKLTVASLARFRLHRSGCGHRRSSRIDDSRRQSKTKPARSW